MNYQEQRIPGFTAADSLTKQFSRTYRISSDSKSQIKRSFDVIRPAWE